MSHLEGEKFKWVSGIKGQCCTLQIGGDLSSILEKVISNRYTDINLAVKTENADMHQTEGGDGSGSFSHLVTGEKVRKAFLWPCTLCCKSLEEKLRNFKDDFFRLVESLLPDSGSITFLVTCCYAPVYYDIAIVCIGSSLISFVQLRYALCSPPGKPSQISSRS